MSDEQPRDDEIEVEGHGTASSGNDEAAEEDENEFEAHILRTPSVRME
jgi:hypothetical protein